ncbi:MULTISPECIES: hypothetical protein [Streptomyces]|uniref:hypothetical protein n=1 Tax=Streptomyces TaxID=1883 RepID=UPI000A3AC062|nr:MULTISPECIES: hypothetical protein [Streptomyces]MCE3029865.1 hypothetical protein [Streptomyces sp. CMSTAAHL-2]MYQ97888.1 hypothetical protein [Streptomyces sp. SID6139]MYR23765.1 hypothetical protein [Streptomyces sp. SID6137]
MEVEMKKTPEQIVSDNMWGSSALFCVAAFAAFVIVGGESAVRVGWILYFAGWVPPICMAAWCAVRRRSPGVGGAFAFTILPLFGLLYWLLHG